jgi:hypothetical protein
MISEGKNDAHSGSESSASEELSQHSTSMVTLANARRNLATQMEMTGIR